jgi:hypothetical protein
MALFLGSLCSSILDDVSAFMPAPGCLITTILQYILKSESASSSFVLSAQDCSGKSELIAVPHGF